MAARVFEIVKALESIGIKLPERCRKATIVLEGHGLAYVECEILLGSPESEVAKMVGQPTAETQRFKLVKDDG